MKAIIRKYNLTFHQTNTSQPCWKVTVKEMENGLEIKNVILLHSSSREQAKADVQKMGITRGEMISMAASKHH